jgi:hypothetical protein
MTSVPNLLMVVGVENVMSWLLQMEELWPERTESSTIQTLWSRDLTLFQGSVRTNLYASPVDKNLSIRNSSLCSDFTCSIH